MAVADSVKLSKNLLRMKFMQRRLDVEQKLQLDEDERRIISDERWYLDLPELLATENMVIEERSFVCCEGLTFGRISFKGFNPEVEKLMQLLNSPDNNPQHSSNPTGLQTDITDEEMAIRYESLVGSMKKRFARKRVRPTTIEDLNQNTVDGPKQNEFLTPQ